VFLVWAPFGQAQLHWRLCQPGPLRRGLEVRPAQAPRMLRDRGPDRGASTIQSGVTIAARRKEANRGLHQLIGAEADIASPRG